MASTTTKAMLGSLAFIIAIFMFMQIAGLFGEKIGELTSDLPKGEWLHYEKYYDGNRVFEFQYGGHHEPQSPDLIGLDAEDVKVIVVDKDHNQIEYSFKKDIKPFEVIQVDIPEDALNVLLTYKGEIVQ